MEEEGNGKTFLRGREGTRKALALKDEWREEVSLSFSPSLVSVIIRLSTVGTNLENRAGTHWSLIYIRCVCACVLVRVCSDELNIHMQPKYQNFTTDLTCLTKVSNSISSSFRIVVPEFYCFGE